VYLNATDPKLATRTWQEVMENIVAKKTDETRRRWEVAIKDRNFDCIRRLHVCETRPEHFDRVLADGKVSSNVYLRRIHNHALGMERQTGRRAAVAQSGRVVFMGQASLSAYGSVRWPEVWLGGGCLLTRRASTQAERRPG
jgi:hypothetical protein